MTKIGKLLKAERIKQGLSLEDVAQRTKIHIYKLRAIEEGNEVNLPAKVFAVGLIKSYARELKIDANTVDKLCLEAFPEDTPEPEAPSSPENNETPVETQSLGWFQVPKAISIGLSAVVSLALIVVIFWVVNKLNAYSKEEKLHITDLPTQRGLQPSQKKAVTPVQKDKKTDKEAPTDKTSKKKVAKKVAKPVEVKPKKVAPKITKPTAQPAEKKTQPVAPVTPTPTPPKSETVNSDNKLVIHSLSPVRLEIRWDDGYVQVMLLKGQETKTLVFSSPIQVKINNGGAVRVSFNNSKPKIPGQLNQPVELKYP